MSKQVCRDFARKGTCQFKNCKYLHVTSKQAFVSPGWQAQGCDDKIMRNTVKRLSKAEQQFQAWKCSVPEGAPVEPLGNFLSLFFREARRLIETDDDIAQQIIQCLASEGGLARVKELIDRDFDGFNVGDQKAVATDEILPFFMTISHPSVLSSLVLEQSVGAIYNFVFGLNGCRAVPLLGFIADALIICVNHEERPIWQLEVSLRVLSRLADLKSAAVIQESLRDLAQKFEQVLVRLSASDAANLLDQARTNLERLQHRLEFDNPRPVNQATGMSQRNPVRHPQTRSDHHVTGAGKLPVSPSEMPGGRHDNDHTDICEIKIMPTSQEISCRLNEYLPVKDPAQWHVGGVDGLLDRNFRLLREDTVGQVRDAVRSVLQPSPSQRTSETIRTNIYRQASVVGLCFDRLSGLQFEIAFPQPTNVQRMGPNQRQEWWELSKRLQPDALVCLSDNQGAVIFCTVVTVHKPRQPTKQGEAQQKPQRPSGDSSSLWINEKTASVVLALAESTDQSIRYVLNHSGPRKATSTFLVIEFPEVLLPSFQPTLRALQRVKDVGGLPFSDLLMPSNPHGRHGHNNAEVMVSPPAYASNPGFHFELGCLSNNDIDLKFRPGEPFDIRALRSKSGLDEAQAVALIAALGRKVGLIQGPPGTGKSYTGVALIKVLLASKYQVGGSVGFGPVICVCYTNHALDQLLEDLIDKRVTSNIVRIGSQSKSEKLAPFNLRIICQNNKRSRYERSIERDLYEDLNNCSKEFQGLRLGEQDIGGSLKDFLDENYSQHCHHLFGVDEEGFTKTDVKDPTRVINRWLQSGRSSNNSPRPIAELETTDLDKMSLQERQLLYQHWLEETRADLQVQAKHIISSHAAAKRELDKIRSESDLRCLRDADVIGMTTTGLARNLDMLRRLNSKVLLCEEAGEVTEPHLLTALLPSVEHAILIGDHLQLRPQIQNFQLSRENPRGKQYSLDVSLFERLVEPQRPMGARIPYSSLETQRRMHPSISRLIRDALYPQLKDAPSVSEYPEVAGMRKRLFWLDHGHPEAGRSSNDANATSHWNDYEVRMTAALVNHLIQQGRYQGGDIAVVTPYLGQLHRLRRLLGESFSIVLGDRDQEELQKAGLGANGTEKSNKPQRSTLLQTLRVATVDNFQGEEAKIVVISLVRSNVENNCGFLRTSNRINVLLSRAQHGMYIIGNSETSRHVSMWARVLDILQKNGNFGSKLELQCPRHPDTPIAVSKPNDFTQFSPEGGCSLQCASRLACGHACIQKCHSSMLHNSVYCRELCPKPQKGCDHPCPKLCGDPCPPKCLVKVYQADRKLPCGHLMPYLLCWQAQDLSTVHCPQQVEKAVPGCNHKIMTFCYVDVKSSGFKCTSPCRAYLACGHDCKRQCWECTVRDASGDVQTDHGKCQHQCGRNHSTCAHACNALCHDQELCPGCELPCDVHCGHSKCPKKCSEPCVPCSERCLSVCPHSTCSMPCAAPCDHVPCSKRCEKRLACGHQCPSVCGECCPARDFCQVCGSEEIRAREVSFVSRESYGAVDLNANPCIFPRCGHFLTMKSMDAQMDLKQCYVVNADGNPIAVGNASQPFSMADVKTCATCRGPLRDIARYGRLIRRALLDDYIKKFTLYVNRTYASLFPETSKEIQMLGEHGIPFGNVFESSGDIKLEGSIENQINTMNALLTKHKMSRWNGMLKLRLRIVLYQRQVRTDEQPFNRVWNTVENVRRRKPLSTGFSFDETVLQPTGFLLASTLLMRLDVALLTDFLSLRQRINGPNGRSKLHLNLQENRKECQQLIDAATTSQRALQQAEGNLFLAQLDAIERAHVKTPAITGDYLGRGCAALQESKRICAMHSDQTRGLSDELDEVEKMLAAAEFYTTMPSDERLAAVAAMAQDVDAATRARDLNEGMRRMRV